MTLYMAKEPIHLLPEVKCNSCVINVWHSVPETIRVLTFLENCWSYDLPGKVLEYCWNL